jgi:putative ABC transport system substrate-binding protein
MKAKILLYALPALVLAAIHMAEAQQLEKIPRIGYLTAGARSVAEAREEAFRQGLREFGYITGKNIIIEYIDMLRQLPTRSLLLQPNSSV